MPARVLRPNWRGLQAAWRAALGQGPQPLFIFVYLLYSLFVYIYIYIYIHISLSVSLSLSMYLCISHASGACLQTAPASNAVRLMPPLAPPTPTSCKSLRPITLAYNAVRHLSAANICLIVLQAGRRPTCLPPVTASQVAAHGPQCNSQYARGVLATQPHLGWAGGNFKQRAAVKCKLVLLPDVKKPAQANTEQGGTR